MYKRTAEEALKRLAEQFPVVGITGPRQSGKSTLSKMVFPEKKYITFDDAGLREIAKSDPKSFLLAFPNGAIIDEAQKVPEIFDAVKYYVDNSDFVPGKFILTGSSQFKLRKNMSDSLAGRIAMINLLPFSIGELNSTENTDAFDLAVSGFYPPFFDENKHYSKDDWFKNYIDTYIENDVKNEINPSNISSFKKFIRICALNSGNLLNYDSLARDTGVSAVTAKSWISILESSFIIHLLQVDSENLGKSLIKTPKLFFVDCGLLCYFLRIKTKNDLILNAKYKGIVIETMAVSELLKAKTNMGQDPYLTFFRDNHGFEIDTIANWERTYAIEVKSDSQPQKKHSDHLRKYLSLRNDKSSGAVFYLGEMDCTIDGIDYISWRHWTDFADR